jgi:tetratricopeptide (TPR) repeat protein
LFWLAPILVALVSLAVWSNHFKSTFQDGDFHVIVDNRALHPGAIPHFFVNPLLYADEPELAEYRPLALVSLTIDSSLTKPVAAGIFAIDSFAWFLLDGLLFCILCFLIPGLDRRCALFAAALFAFHPVTGETLNYASRRGDLIGASGFLAGLAFWIIWPRHLPARIIHFEGVPKTDWDEFRRKWSPTINARYRGFVEARLGLYLIPVLFGMLADPGVAVFPLVLLAYILVFERTAEHGNPWRRVLRPGIVCGLAAAAQCALTWKYAAGYRMPALSYWATEPWVIVRYLLTFLAPVNLTAGSDLHVFPHVWEPLALTGFAAVIALIALAVRLAKAERWRVVSFGLWWFLIALLPTILVPQRDAEADYRMYLPLMGLAIAASGAGWILYQRSLLPRRPQLQADLIAGFLAAAVLSLCCGLTFARTAIWESQDSFWEDVTRKSPGNGRAFIRYAEVLESDGMTDRGLANLRHAAALISTASPADAPDEIELARAFDRFNVDKETVDHFQRALKANPDYAPAWSAWSRWLVLHRRLQEAYQAATHALQISPWDTQAEHTLLDYYSAVSDWPHLKKQAEETLRLDPTDADAYRSLEVADAGARVVRVAEDKAKADPTVNGFLTLSVQYYRARRFEDVVSACNQALKLQPDLAEAYSNMAAAYYALGKNDEAIHALREAIRIHPDLPDAKANLAFLLSLQAEKPKPPAR